MSKPVVLLADELSPATVDALGPDFEIRQTDGADRAQLLSAIADVDAILVRSATQVDAEAIAAAKNLKVIARAGVGLDNVDIKAATQAGYDLTLLEQRVHWRIGLLNERPPIASLAATMALEHFTAILAHELLKDSAHLGKAEAESAALWKWHAAEEIEHKGVAYDTWLHATRDWPADKRWKVKAKVMLLVTRNFIIDRTFGALELLRQDGITGPRAWARLLWYMWVRPGMMRRIFSAWAKYFLPRFHPWNEDDRHLIAGFDLDGRYETRPTKKVRGAA